LNDQYSGALFDREPLLSIAFLIAIHALILILTDQHLSTAIAIEPALKCELSILIISWYIEVDAAELLEPTGCIFAFKALNLTATLPTEDLLDRCPRLVTKRVAHSGFF